MSARATTSGLRAYDPYPKGTHTVPLIDTLYPRRCAGSGHLCRQCAHPTTRLIVCLPADTAHEQDLLGVRLAQALSAHIPAPVHWVDCPQFFLLRTPDTTEAAVLLSPVADPDLPKVTWCAGGPIGLLDLTRAAAYIGIAVADDVDDWNAAVAGTPPAAAWWNYHDDHTADPHRYPLRAALADFEAQPRIATMTAQVEPAFRAHQFGPGLDALHAGTDTYREYESGLLLYGDGLITLDGQLLLPACTPLLVEQSLTERQLYHHRAGRYLSGLDPTVVLTAVRCVR
jgi:hypothetical protein